MLTLAVTSLTVLYANTLGFHKASGLLASASMDTSGLCRFFRRASRLSCMQVPATTANTWHGIRSGAAL